MVGIINAHPCLQMWPQYKASCPIYVIYFNSLMKEGYLNWANNFDASSGLFICNHHVDHNFCLQFSGSKIYNPACRDSMAEILLISIKKSITSRCYIWSISSPYLVDSGNTKFCGLLALHTKGPWLTFSVKWRGIGLQFLQIQQKKL